MWHQSPSSTLFVFTVRLSVYEKHANLNKMLSNYRTKIDCWSGNYIELNWGFYIHLWTNISYLPTMLLLFNVLLRPLVGSADIHQLTGLYSLQHGSNYIVGKFRYPTFSLFVQSAVCYGDYIWKHSWFIHELFSFDWTFFYWFDYTSIHGFTNDLSRYLLFKLHWFVTISYSVLNECYSC